MFAEASSVKFKTMRFYSGTHQSVKVLLTLKLLPQEKCSSLPFGLLLWWKEEPPLCCLEGLQTGSRWTAEDHWPVTDWACTCWSFRQNRRKDLEAPRKPDWTWKSSHELRGARQLKQEGWKHKNGVILFLCSNESLHTTVKMAKGNITLEKISNTEAHFTSQLITHRNKILRTCGLRFKPVSGMFLKFRQRCEWPCLKWCRGHCSTCS